MRFFIGYVDIEHLTFASGPSFSIGDGHLLEYVCLPLSIQETSRFNHTYIEPMPNRKWAVRSSESRRPFAIG